MGASTDDLPNAVAVLGDPGSTIDEVRDVLARTGHMPVEAQLTSVSEHLEDAEREDVSLARQGRPVYLEKLIGIVVCPGSFEILALLTKLLRHRRHTPALATVVFIPSNHWRAILPWLRDRLLEDDDAPPNAPDCVLVDSPGEVAFIFLDRSQTGQSPS